MEMIREDVYVTVVLNGKNSTRPHAVTVYSHPVRLAPWGAA